MTDPQDAQTRIYRVDVFAYLFAAVTVVFTIVGLTILLPDAIQEGASDVAFIGVWLTILAWFWFNVLRSPYEVRIHSDGRIDFRSLMRRQSVHANEIWRIQGLWFPGGVVVHHARGRIWLRDSPREMYAFLQDIERLNPAVEIQGL